jgi:hypothetical protein
LVGYSAGLKNLGGGNTAVGSFAMYDMNDGSSNTAVGRLALNNSIDGSSNVAVGTNAMASDTSGSWNVAIGLNALFEQINADDNVAIGPRAMHDNLTGSKNVVMGTWAMRSDTTGDRNVAIGYESGGTTSAVNRSGSVFLGYRAGYHESNSDRLYIANSSSSSPLIYGEFDNDLFRVHGTFSVSDASGSSEYLTVTPNGELILSATSGDEMTIINDNEWTWGGSSLNFGDGGDHFIIASRESSTESAGIYGDGNNLTLWSPGDQAPGQPSALLYLLDEDLFADANSDPYDNGALKAYVSQTGVWTVSDRRKKNAIKPMDNSLTKVLRMQGYTYQYNQEDEEVRKSTPSKEVAGLMAQELEQIFPQAVDRNDAGEYFVNTNMLIPVLVEAIKEQQHSIQELRDQNERLHAQLGSIADQLKDNQGQID